MNIKNSIYLIICIFIFTGISVTFNQIVPPDIETQLRINGLNLQKQYDAISIGNSHSVALRLELMNFEKVYYLWDDGSDLFDCFATYKYLCDNDIHTDYLFIPIPPGTELLDNGVLQLKERKRQQTYYYFGANRFAWADYRNYLKSRLLPVIRPDHCLSVWRNMFNQRYTQLKIFDNNGFFIKRRNNVNLIDLEAADTLAFERVRTVRNIYSLIDTVESKTFNSEVVEWGITMCKQNNTKVIFYTPPYYYRFNKLLENEHKSTQNFVNKFVIKHSNVSYYDFSNDTTFTHHFEYFINPDHLT